MGQKLYQDLRWQLVQRKSHVKASILYGRKWKTFVAEQTL